MASSYPATLDAFATNKQDDTDSKTGGDLGLSTTVGDHATHHNDLADAINKIEASLGINPAGGFADLVTRLQSLDLKQSCKLATTADIGGTYANGTAGVGATLTIGGTALTLDGIAVANGDTVLVKDQNTPLQNGKYTVSGVGTAVLFTRTNDADTAGKLSDTSVFTVEQGAANQDTGWELVTNNVITVGTTSLWYTRIWPDYEMTAISGPAGRLWLPTGAKIENCPSMATTLGSQATAATGVMRLSPLGVLRAGHSLTSVTFITAATAGASLTNRWAGIVRQSDRKLVAVSANDTSAAWAANTAQTFTFTSTYTADKDELFWSALTIVGTTLPNFMALSVPNTVAYASPIRTGSSNTGLTTPLAVNTIVNAPSSGTTSILYCYAS